MIWELYYTVFLVVANSAFYIALMFVTLHAIVYAIHYASGNDLSEWEIHYDSSLKEAISGIVNLKAIKPKIFMILIILFILASCLFALTWIVAIPIGIILMPLTYMRQKNIHKKKMWQTLRE